MSSLASSDFQLDVTHAEPRIHGITLAPVVVFRIHVLYAGDSWVIHRRYSQFVTLHSELNDLYPDVKLPRLPPKTIALFAPSSAKSSAIQKRLQLLQTYATELIKDPVVRQSPVVLDWIQLANDVRLSLFFETRNMKKNEKKHFLFFLIFVAPLSRLSRLLISNCSLGNCFQCKIQQNPVGQAKRLLLLKLGVRIYLIQYEKNEKKKKLNLGFFLKKIFCFFSRFSVVAKRFMILKEDRLYICKSSQVIFFVFFSIVNVIIRALITFFF